MADREKVTSTDILHEEGADSPVTGGTWLQRTGAVLAACVGTLAAIVTIALVGKWMCVAPQLPAVPPGTDINTAKAILENYKSLQQVALEPYTALFESIVVKVLLPVFTSILGYIFGSQRSHREG
jgi:hypothetical protein